MNATLPTLVGAALIAALPLAPVSAVQDDSAAPAAGGLLPAATKTIDIPADRDLSLADLVDSLADSTGLRFVVSSQTRQILNDTPCGLLSGGVIQPEEAYSFVESVLKRHRVVVERLAGEDVPVAALYWLDGGRDSNAIGWSTVPADQVEIYADHHALLVQCILDVSPVDARQLTTSVRGMLRDTNYQNVLSLGNTSVIVRGTGSDVAQMVQMFRQTSKNDAAYYEALRAAQEAAGGPQQPGGGR